MFTPRFLNWPSRRRWSRLASLTVAGLALLVASAAMAETAEERLAALEQQVATLKAQLAQAHPAAPADLAEITRKLEALAAELERLKLGESSAEASQTQFGFGRAASKIYRTFHGVSIGGYGEFVYENYAQEKDNGADSGKVDQADALRGVLYVGYKFNERFLFNMELELEHTNEISLEFAYLDWMPRKEIGVRGGLLLIPMGLLNEWHEPTLFLSAKRTLTEQNLLPSTWRENGFGVFGEVGPIAYRSYLVNGFKGSAFAENGLRGGRQKGGKALAEDWAWTGRIDYVGTPGLTVGGSWYWGGAGQELPFELATTLLDAHLDYRWKGLRLRALGAWASLDEVEKLNAATGRSVAKGMMGWYGEVGYDIFSALSGLDEMSLTPFARYEALNTQDRMPTGYAANPANDQTAVTFGLAFQPIDQIVIKADYTNLENEADSGVDQINVALGYIF